MAVGHEAGQGLTLRAPPSIATILLVLATSSLAVPSVALADTGLTARAARALVDSITPRIEEIRCLKFKQAVPVEVTDDAVARTHFEGRLHAERSGVETELDQDVYIDLGLLPARTSLKATIVNALEEQAGGYYDSKREVFSILGGMPRSIRSFIVSHELTHALDDQYFDLDGMIEKAGGDDERIGGIAAVVEGSGTLVMSIFVGQEYLSGSATRDDAREFQKSEVGQAKRLKATPQIVLRQLIGPYILGMNFLLRGNRSPMPRMVVPKGDLERAFRDPPVSWEQVLHPEKYWYEEARDIPRLVALPDLSATLGDGWALAGEGSLGELVLAVLTDRDKDPLDPTSRPKPRKWTNKAAAGWGGNRWHLYRRGDDTVTVVATVWDTEKDAREFHAALPRPLRKTAVRDNDAVVVVVGEAGMRARTLAVEALRGMTSPSRSGR